MEVTTSMLADAARVENGKLYIHGGGWDQIMSPDFPTTHSALAVALVFRIEYNEALEDIPVAVVLEDEDGDPLGPRMEGTINSGHPPGTSRGAPTFHPIAITLNGLQFDSPGRYQFRVSSASGSLATIPFSVKRVQQAPKG